MILVTGPTGNTGKLIIEGLRQRRVPFVAMVRSNARQQELMAAGIPSVQADFEQPHSLEAVLADVRPEKAYLVCAPDERLVRCERNFIHAAKAAGVRHIVKCGAYAAAHDSQSPNLRMHAAVEDALVSSNIPYTIIRPHGFMQTFFWMSAPLVMQHGILSYPAQDGPMPLIDVRDVGAALLKVLCELGHENRTYNLTGPEPLRPSRMAEILSESLNRPIRYVESSLDDLDALMRQLGVPDAPREHVLWAFREQAAGRFNYTSPDGPALGLRLRSFSDFAADLAAGLTGAATSDFRT
ncbi:MAG: SDR family oxidoreductase [Myxococcales bacterium]|nr:SDR family oxidoreductase [Myxococcales bacterium]